MIPRIQKILYPTDLSDNSTYVFRCAINSAKKHDVKITIFHVADQMSAATAALAGSRIDHANAFGAAIDVVASMVEAKNNQIEDVQQVELGLEHTKALLEEANIPCKTHLLIRGLSPGEDLVQFARENKIDEIIVGVKKRSKIGKLILGSTAQHVILTAPCPVVTIK
jgi:nucleotide-binding universal stress UspA family protein